MDCNKSLTVPRKAQREESLKIDKTQIFENATIEFNKKRKRDSNCTAIEHKVDVHSDIACLFNSDQFSDVCFVVEGEKINAHRVILATRSDYFRALLFGGMKESSEHTIEMHDVSKSAFKAMLQYIYTGIVTSEDVEKMAFELLCLSDWYCLTKLHKSLLSFIQQNLNIGFALKAYEIGKHFNVKELIETCINFIEVNALEILNHESFFETQFDTINDLISRDTFVVPEIKLYKRLVRYLKHNEYSTDNMKTIVREVIRFHSMTLGQFTDHVNVYMHHDGIFDHEECDQLLRERKHGYRYVLLKDLNYFVNVPDCKVLKGSPIVQIDTASVKFFRKLWNHEYKGDSVIELSLGKRCKMNHIRTLGYIQPMKREPGRNRLNYKLREEVYSLTQMNLNSVERGYDYKYTYDVYVSADYNDWRRVTTSRAFSHLWQCIYFKPEIVKYVRLVIADVEESLCSAIFHLLHFQCFYSTKQFDFDNDSNLIPFFNVMSAPKIPTFYPGSIPEEYFCVFDGRTLKELYSVCSSHEISDEEENSLLFTLCQDCVIDTITLHLWDKDNREYDYEVKGGTLREAMTSIAKRTHQSSKHVISFEPRVVRFIEIIGTAVHNVRTTDFKLVSLRVCKESHV